MTTEQRPRRLISPDMREWVQTRADIVSPVSGMLSTVEQAPSETSDEIEDALKEWVWTIDHQLIEWGRDPAQFDEEGIDPPNGRTIGRAIELARSLGSRGLPSPTRVVPDAHGGIVFERQSDRMFETIRINADRTYERCVFNGSKLIWRERW